MKKRFFKKKKEFLKIFKYKYILTKISQMHMYIKKHTKYFLQVREKSKENNEVDYHSVCH